MASLKDIANELNISESLVSKVLNDRMGTTRASSRLRNRIVKKAQAMGYKPNRYAIALAGGRKGAIGIFINPWGEYGTEFSQSFLAGVSESLKSTPYHIWLNFFRRDSEFHEQMDIQDMKNRVDGIMIGGFPHPKLLPHLRSVEKAGIPVVTFFERQIAKTPANITVDIVHQGYQATTHLADRGCFRIAHFHTRDERYKGYLSALLDADRRMDPALIVKCVSFSVADGRAATRRLLQSGIEFDGIVAQSDHQAFGACLELLDRGIGVPDQVRIIGVDDSPLCLASPIPLTSVTSECDRIGSIAMEFMLKKLAGDEIVSTLISPRLVKRSST